MMKRTSIYHSKKSNRLQSAFDSFFAYFVWWRCYEIFFLNRFSRARKGLFQFRKLCDA